MGLRIEVDQKDPFFPLCQTGGKVYGSSGLTTSPLLIGNGYLSRLSLLLGFLPLLKSNLLLAPSKGLDGPKLVLILLYVLL